MDMSGFAINFRLFLEHPNATFSHLSTRGMQESDFLSTMVSLGDLEPKANNCTEIYVWHTKTERMIVKPENELLKHNITDDPSILIKV